MGRLVKARAVESGGIALIFQLGGSFLLAQIVGDIGKKKEPGLFEYCGGRPTELLLSHEHAPNKIVPAWTKSAAWREPTR